MPFWSPETSILLPNYHSPRFDDESGLGKYEAIDDCRPNRHKLMKLYLTEIPTNERPIIAGDHTPLPRPIEINDPSWGLIEILRWSQFHFSHSADHPMEIILIQRKGKGLSQKAAKPMWLAWIGKRKTLS